MRVSFIGGMHDGQSFDVPQPLPPVWHMAVPIEEPVAVWLAAAEDPLAMMRTSFTTATYRLAYTVLDHRPYYVEERVLERWGSIDYELLTGT